MTPKDTPPGAMAMSEARLAERLSLFKEMARGYSLSADGGDPLGRYVAEFIANADTIIAALRECATLRAQVQAGREAALEEAAKVADAVALQREQNAVAADHGSWDWGEPKSAFMAQSHKALTARDIATQIRALAQPAKTEGAEG